MIIRHFAALLVAATAAVGCSGSSNNPAANEPGGYTISIANMAWSPANLTVPAGATVTVVNNDGFPHTVTSESAKGQFTPGSVSGVSFDTGSFNGTASFRLPDSIADGTVIPYYCAIHKGSMVPADGTITIKASAAGGAGGGGSGGAPGAAGAPGGGGMPGGGMPGGGY
jgi:plastocyanin